MVFVGLAQIAYALGNPAQASRQVEIILVALQKDFASDTHADLLGIYWIYCQVLQANQAARTERIAIQAIEIIQTRAEAIQSETTTAFWRMWPIITGSLVQSRHKSDQFPEKRNK